MATIGSNVNEQMEQQLNIIQKKDAISEKIAKQSQSPEAKEEGEEQTKEE